jgi:hypothetical protein
VNAALSAKTLVTGEDIGAELAIIVGGGIGRGSGCGGSFGMGDVD